MHQYLKWGNLFVDEYFGHQIADRFEEGGFCKASPWWYFPGLVLQLYWPWLPLAVWGCVRLFRPSSWREAPVVRLLIVWLVGFGAAIQAVNPKYDRYLCSLYPALAITAAAGLVSIPTLWNPWKRWVLPHLGWATLLLVVILGIAGVPVRRTEMPELQAARPAIQAALRRPGDPVVLIFGSPGQAGRCALLFNTDADYRIVDAEELKAAEPGRIVMADRQSADRVQELLPSTTCLAKGERFAFYQVR